MSYHNMPITKFGVVTPTGKVHITYRPRMGNLAANCGTSIDLQPWDPLVHPTTNPCMRCVGASRWDRRPWDYARERLERLKAGAPRGAS